MGMRGSPSLDWRKSTRCESGACVEVALTVDQLVAIRNSTDPDGPVLTFSKDAWNAFMKDIQGGKF
jgi:hypothetical protein